MSQNTENKSKSNPHVVLSTAYGLTRWHWGTPRNLNCIQNTEGTKSQSNRTGENRLVKTFRGGKPRGMPVKGDAETRNHCLRTWEIRSANWRGLTPSEATQTLKNAGKSRDAGAMQRSYLGAWEPLTPTHSRLLEALLLCILIACCFLRTDYWNWSKNLKTKSTQIYR